MNIYPPIVGADGGLLSPLLTNYQGSSLLYSTRWWYRGITVLQDENGEFTSGFLDNYEATEFFLDKVDNSVENITIFCCKNGKTKSPTN